MKVLAIDTSNYQLGVALIEEDKVVGEFMTNLKKNHSLRAMPAIEMLLGQCDVKPKELTKIVVAQGPGSYTGVRIGVTIAKTMSWSLNIPIAGVSSLAVLASSGRYFDGLLCPVFDARRGQVYTGLYKYEEGKLVTLVSDSNLLMSDWVDHLNEYQENILFLGHDVDIHREVISSKLKEQGKFAHLSSHNPRPAELAFLGLEQESEHVHGLVPNYIRMAEAEVKWLESQKDKE
jgi:tRNA threonylcarbamoyladenosine biosynthesis protein TsaB